MTNKRKHKRIPLAAVATINYEDQGGILSLHAMTGSISYGGVGLYSDDPIKEETDCSVTINFISTEGNMETVSVEGRVVYSKKIGDMFFSGVQFDEEVNDINHPLLYRQIQSASAWDAI